MRKQYFGQKAFGLGGSLWVFFGVGGTSVEEADRTWDGGGGAGVGRGGAAESVGGWKALSI